MLRNRHARLRVSSLVTSAAIASLVACSAPEEANDGISGTLIVRSHHDVERAFVWDEELVLANGDRVALERADASTSGMIVDADGETRPIDLLFLRAVVF